MHNAEVDLSIIIVNYKSLDLVENCIVSVRKWTTKVRYEIIIVNNDDVSIPQTEIGSEKVFWFDMGYNAGFSRANNFGIKQSKGKVVLLLNSDTVLQNNAIEIAFERLTQDPNTGVVSVQLLNSDFTPQNAGSTFFTGGLNFILTLPFLNSVFRALGKKVGIKKPGLVSSPDLVKVDWVSGAFMMIKKDIFKQAGLMDEDFFLYSEEIEWCSRLSDFGEIIVDPRGKVLHLEGGTTRKVGMQETSLYYELWTYRGAQLMLSHLVRIRKQYGLIWLAIHGFVLFIEIPIFIIGSLLSRTYRLNHSILYTKNVFKVFQYLPKIVLGKPYFYKLPDFK